VNEDAVVSMLKTHGIMEVFTECLTTEQKVAMFAQAELVVGVIGGGMCNLLFSPQTTKSVCIVTPDFLEINERFKHSMDHTQIVYSYSTQHVPSAPYKYTLYTRVKVTNPESPVVGKVGEIEEHCGSAYIVRMSSNDVAGFSQDFAMEARLLQEWELEPLDNGLNSPYTCDIQQLETCLKKFLEV
jgi:capsular polysaccharide biosynthesis protein